MAGKRKDATKVDHSSGEDTDGSLTSFSDTESEPEVGYLKKKNKRKGKKNQGDSQIFLGVHQRIWMILFLLVSASAVIILCIYGDARQLDYDHWEANEVLPNLYLGDYKDGLNRKMLNELGITHILTIALGIEPNFLQEYHYMTVRAQDHSSQDLLSYLEPLHEFIDEGRKSGGILVHCKVGQSRSVMITTSYIMREKRWNTYESLEFLKKIRPRITPRKTFVEQLAAYHHFNRDLTNPELQEYTSNFPNKAQVTKWPAPGTNESVTKFPQPHWVEEEIIREWWDTVVHHFMDFYNRYLRYYEK